ncbi:MAG: stage II sporulation protein R [Oscillospiraceae bacterium]|nr:stage II sporulation protein R [Oscillospiraceae bacterium]
MKKLQAAAAIGLILAIAWGNFASFQEHLQNLHSDVLRLHILANSDTPADQERKLLVRDELLRHSEELFSGCDTLAEMKQRALEKQETIRLLAQDVLKKHGCTDKVTVQLVQMDFDERQYDEITMPAGAYDALRILIGKGEGHNWWCVMYPPLCLPAASADAYFDEETSAILTQPEQFEVKFKCVELLQSLHDAVS